MKLDDVIKNVHRYSRDVIVISEAEPFCLPGPRIVFVNEAFTEQTGYTAEEAIGQTPRLLQGPETDRQTLNRIHEGLQKWQHVREEVLNYRKDGTKFWSELSIVPVADESGWYRYWISSQRDVTDRHETTERLQLTIAASGDGIWDWNVKTNELFWSDRFKEIVGVDQEDFVPHVDTFFDRLPEEDKDRVSEQLQAHFEQGEPFDVSYRLRHEKGHYVHISAKGQAAWGSDGSPVRMVGTVSDVSNAVRDHSDLQEAQLLSGSGHCSLGPNADQSHVSELVWDILGMDAPEGDPWTALMDALGDDAAGAVDLAIDTAYDEPRTLEFKRMKGDREQFLRVRLKTREDGPGARYVFGILEESTKAVMRERSLATSERLAACGQLAGGVAHDFNNILTAIGMGVEELEEIGETDERQEIAEDVMSAIRQGQDLTDALLNYTRQAPLSPQELDVSHVIRKLARLAELTVPSSIELIVDVPEDLPCLLLDRSGFEASLLNLLINAGDACGEQGTVELKAWCAGGQVNITVEDDGPGIPSELRERVIEPFFTTKADGEGTGIGLARVHGFAIQSGGRLVIGDSPLGGARLQMIFPQSHKEAA